MLTDSRGQTAIVLDGPTRSVTFFDSKGEPTLYLHGGSLAALDDSDSPHITLQGTSSAENKRDPQHLVLTPRSVRLGEGEFGTESARFEAVVNGGVCQLGMSGSEVVRPRPGQPWRISGDEFFTACGGGIATAEVRAGSAAMADFKAGDLGSGLRLFDRAGRTRLLFGHWHAEDKDGKTLFESPPSSIMLFGEDGNRTFDASRQR